jgi:glycosyltransferase involved in cell wall biosynthesis
MAEGPDQSIEVLHVIGESHLGGVMTFVKNITQPQHPGVKHYIWKHRDYHPPADSSATWICEGAAKRTDVSVLSDLIGAARDVPPLLSWTRHHPGAILSAHSRMGLLAAAMVSRIRKAPLLMHMHARARRARLYRRLWELTRAQVVFNSAQTSRHYACDPALSLVIMPSITWPPRPDPAPRTGSKRFRFVAAGAFVPCKNLRVIIDAFTQLGDGALDADLRLFGFSPEFANSDYQQSVVERARKNAAIQVLNWDSTWMQQVTPGDIFVHAGYEESFGIVILEAFALGCRLVVPPNTFLDDLPAPLQALGIERAERPETLLSFKR